MRGVWRHRRFRLFWTGDAVSAAGGALSTVAVPLLAIETLHASGATVGLVRAAQTAPFLLFAVPVGLLVDRMSRRRLMLLADAVRFPLVAALAVAALTGALAVGALVTLVFVVGTCTVAYEVAYLSVLPYLVDDVAELPHANRAVETAHAGASLLGPAAGGALVGLLSAAGVVLLDAASFAAGALFTALNRWTEPPRDHTRTPGLAAGWTWLWANRYVRPMTLYLAVNNFATQAYQTALLLFVLRTLGLPAYVVGLAVGAAGAGFLIGALLSPRAAQRWGIGRVVVAAAVIAALGPAVVASGGLPAVLAGGALAGAGPGLLNLHSIAVRQATTPADVLGRVNAVVKTVSYGATTLGALAGGAAATTWGPRAVILAAAAGSLLAAAIPATTAIRTLRSLPPTPPA